MMNTNPPAVQQPGPDGEPDPRVERSERALRQALHDLLFEGAFDEVTVQQIVARAGVSRGTFYARYRNKDDALLASLDGMLASLERGLAQESPPRLIAAEELLRHVGSAGRVRDALAPGGRLEQVFDYMGDVLADQIQRRLAVFVAPADAAAGSAAGTATGPASPTMPPALAARMLSGAFMEMLRWWADRPDRPDAQAMDAEFHRMARRMLRAGRG
ncbi:MAG: TetR/AcrR family transcriptional regulator [Gemmatimonadaceae bacterium]|nr:TetR/AcrR family transcriptional regulator [Gemmatimonadaceae bacterium]